MGLFYTYIPYINFDGVNPQKLLLLIFMKVNKLSASLMDNTGHLSSLLVGVFNFTH